MRVAKFSGTASLEGAGILIKHFPLLRTDPARAMRLAEEIAGCMVLEDDGKKIIQIAPDDEDAP
jgi:hypothetical protein